MSVQMNAIFVPRHILAHSRPGSLVLGLRGIGAITTPVMKYAPMKPLECFSAQIEEGYMKIEERLLFPLVESGLKNCDYGDDFYRQ